jgi:glycosyltransferase involved in cell wall biosynthesis
MALVRTRDYAAVHAVEDAGIIGLRAARRVGARSIYEKHSDPRSYYSGFLRNRVLSLYHRLESFVIRRVDAVIATGPGLVEQSRETGTRASLHHIFDIPSSRVDADPNDLEAVRQEMQSQEDEVLITYVGSFAVYQGIDLMFDAIPKVLSSVTKARFVVIGGSAAEIDERRNVLEQLGVAGRVSFLGNIHPDDLPPYLAASDILLSPRISGTNTPLKILDYLKAGRAIVASDTPANQLILNDRIAVLAAPEPAAFAAAIQSLCEDGARREALGKTGRRLIDDTYNYDEFRARLATCYADLVSAEE